ncbi:hypothetical protein BDV32DRAFT_148667 [Aspergillus pseudonomiae]|uniref:Uncharacterized protein n=1 Tax=Aspergillus pseudonomiae TaxID=1506151 RepID=A0A5N6I3Z2_9EURO|nr:uncharacterized protein BDV37DRAFT_287421 [Aspergillus pseudonomiae]KAB8261402.1 hypothetical protein BDV32DRAFT_148667 [Aspergillus pseudonomiae]KAE8399589.1 hypothetical protein BDV37DRAFT_287421 [Aspergillus pseudonomiae]
MPNNPIFFDTNGLYILVSDLGSDIQFHWALYLAQSQGQGIMFHVINSIETGNQWQYQTKPITGIPNSLNLLVSLKIAVMDPALHVALVDRLAAVPETPPITCRLWLKRALHELDEEGYIQLTGSIDDIEQEALTEAAENQPRRIRTGLCSRYCVV